MEKMKALLVCVKKTNDDITLEELTMLADTAGYECVAEIYQRRNIPDINFHIGKGKLQELRELAINLEADTIIFDNDLSPRQFKNLEDALEIDVIDRAELILQIFALHATSNEGKLQVELAQKKNSLPRVLGQGHILSRQGGGGGGGGGARRGGGEQQLELDRRTIRKEIKDLELKIDKLTNERRLRREKRQKNRAKVVSIVGYTNAGKSTLMNTLTKAGVTVENKLFATLDPISRKLWLAPQKEFILVDTVGFISRLPHELINAFRSTLEETKYSDLILIVADGSSDNIAKQHEVVKDTLKSIGADKIPSITVINKADIKTTNIFPLSNNLISISAKTGKGIEKLKEKISVLLFGQAIWD